MARLKNSSAGERRTAHFSFQLTPTERRILAHCAYVAGLCIADYVRAVLFRKRLPPLAMPDTRALLAAFSQIGNDIQQIARAADLNGLDAVEREALAVLNAMRLFIAKLMGE